MNQYCFRDKEKKYYYMIKGLLLEYWGIFALADFHIALASSFNMISAWANIPQYSCNNLILLQQT